MSQLRWDPLKLHWVIMADEQSRKPRDFFTEWRTVTTTLCPFCYGQEGRTPAEVYALRPDGSPPNQPGWRVRVIPNKYPLLRIEGELAPRGVGLYDVLNGIGAHEVIIETPDHQRHPADFRAMELADVFRAFRARIMDLRRDGRFRYIMPFKNHGLEAGATIPHAHSQLLALPVIPPRMRQTLHACREFFHHKERCLLCDLLEQELADGRRIIHADRDFVALAPFASRHPFEVLIAPRRHGHDFCQATDAVLLALGEVLREVLRRQRSVLRDPPFNLVLHTSPTAVPRPGRPDLWHSLAQDFHWHLELVPCLARPAGFEWSSDFFINPTPPEDAARFLREAEISAGV